MCNLITGGVAIDSWLSAASRSTMFVSMASRHISVAYANSASHNTLYAAVNASNASGFNEVGRGTHTYAARTNS